MKLLLYLKKKIVVLWSMLKRSHYQNETFQLFLFLSGIALKTSIYRCFYLTFVSECCRHIFMVQMLACVENCVCSWKTNIFIYKDVNSSTAQNTYTHLSNNHIKLLNIMAQFFRIHFVLLLALRNNNNKQYNQ